MSSLETDVTPLEAVWRGLRSRCPHCGQGALFRAYLKVADGCPACGEEFHHHRADDFPVYIVLVLTGHLLIPIVLGVEEYFAPSYWVHAALWIPASLGMCMGLLQPVKGAIVGLQWALGMHGFARRILAKTRSEAPALPHGA